VRPPGGDWTSPPTRGSGVELMPVFKRKYRSGATVWRYLFSAPGSTATDRRLVQEVGFASKQEAIDAEAKRRTEELQKYELAKAGASKVAAALPTTFAMLLQEFFRQHAEEKLAPKTIERYRELAAYLAPELLVMPLGEITPLHLNREWNRLLKSGGHHRKTKEARPLSAKTVRSIAGLVSSAFARAQKWGLVTSNPVKHSEPPVPKKHRGIALTPRSRLWSSRRQPGRGAWRRSWNSPPPPARGAARSWRCAGRIFKMAAPS
jgi:hypothetical protein